MKVKTCELEGAALDWAVFLALYGPMEPTIQHLEAPKGFPTGPYLEYKAAFGERIIWHPSDDWSQGGPLIEKHRILVEPVNDGPWSAECCDPPWGMAHNDPDGSADGDSALMAAMRALVAAKLGRSVDIPGELFPLSE